VKGRSPAAALLALLAPILPVLVGCRADTPSVDPAYRAEIEKWRAARLARLTAPDGWLSLTGLFWLSEGDNTFGSDPADPVVLPAGSSPPVAGVLRLAEGRVTVQARPEVPVRTLDGKPVTTIDLAPDDSPAGPTILTLATVRFYVIRRGERLGVRVKDSESPVRKNFTRIDSFPIDPSWRVDARFEPYDPPKEIAVPTELGTVEKDVSPGALIFEHAGKTYRLDPVLEPGSDELFVIFGDRTNGRDTYGAGRFVYAPFPRNGRTILDFNKAYNPPCAFTPYATCPLPPPENRLPLRVEAGEKRYTGPTH
jgi:uncharacterized protein (DUF1684 family)